MKKIYKFETPGCGPCKLLGDFLNDNEHKLRDFEIQPVNIFDEEGNDLAAKYRIRSSPTLVYVDDDGDVSTFVGFSSDRSPQLLMKWLQELK